VFLWGSLLYIHKEGNPQHICGGLYCTSSKKGIPSNFQGSLLNLLLFHNHTQHHHHNFTNTPSTTMVADSEHASLKIPFFVNMQSVYAAPPCQEQDNLRQQEVLRTTLQHHANNIAGILRPACPLCEQCDIDTDVQGALSCSWCDAIFCKDCDLQFCDKDACHEHTCLAKQRIRATVLDSTILRNARWAKYIVEYCSCNVTLKLMDPLLMRFRMTFERLGIDQDYFNC